MSAFWAGFLCGFGFWIVCAVALAAVFVAANRTPVASPPRRPRFTHPRRYGP